MSSDLRDRCNLTFLTRQTKKIKLLFVTIALDTCNQVDLQRHVLLFFFLYTVYWNIVSVGHLTRKSGVLGSIPGLATYFRFSFRFFKKGSCQLLAKVCARSTG